MPLSMPNNPSLFHNSGPRLVRVQPQEHERGRRQREKSSTHRGLADLRLHLAKNNPLDSHLLHGEAQAQVRLFYDC